MTFKSLALNDLNVVLLNTAEFGEAVTYKVYINENTSTTKSINAVVFRNQETPFDLSNNRNLTKTCRVIISNDAIAGISSIKTRLDRISIPEYIGGTAVYWRVIEILRHDDVSWELLCRK